MYHLMGYNKDRDVYNELIVFDDVCMTNKYVKVCKTMLLKDELKDETGEPYDWIEIWNDEDDNGVDDIIIAR